MLEAGSCGKEADQSFSAYSVDGLYRRDLGDCVDTPGKETEQLGMPRLRGGSLQNNELSASSKKEMILYGMQE
ncbi:MAG: hypothetical protein ACYTBV_11260 [Planctomycetota bacterium]|jgi:hypothetical protein